MFHSYVKLPEHSNFWELTVAIEGYWESRGGHCSPGNSHGAMVSHMTHDLGSLAIVILDVFPEIHVFLSLKNQLGWLGFCPNFWRDSQVVHFMIFAEVYPFRDDELLQEWSDWFETRSIPRLIRNPYDGYGWLWVIKLCGCLAGHIHHKKWVKWVSPFINGWEYDENL